MTEPIVNPYGITRELMPIVGETMPVELIEGATTELPYPEGVTWSL